MVSFDAGSRPRADMIGDMICLWPGVFDNVDHGMRVYSTEYPRALHLELPTRKLLEDLRDRGIPTAAVRLIGPEGQVIADAALGTGPVDAIYKAINRLVGVTNKLTEFSVKSVTEGIDAIGEVLIRVESDGVTYTGRGADTDIIVASAKAYINALNRLLTTKKTTE